MENIEKQKIELSNVLETLNTDNTVIETIPETESLVGDKQHICIIKTPETATMRDSSSACQCCTQKIGYRLDFLALVSLDSLISVGRI